MNAVSLILLITKFMFFKSGQNHGQDHKVKFFLHQDKGLINVIMNTHACQSNTKAPSLSVQ